MLNPDLKLNSKMFDADALKQATRDGFGTGIVSLGEKDENVVVLTADLSESTRTEEFSKKFPERFFDCGVAEQNMAAIAAGLAVNGKTAFVSSYATFSPGKNWETIRTTIIYNHANVKIAGHHSGIMTGPDGSTHQATEDVAITRSWPGISIMIPCDSVEAKKTTEKAASIDGPVYLRFSRDKSAVMTTIDTPFDGKVQEYWISENPSVTIFGTGHMLYWALLAAKELEDEGINVSVVNVATVKPLDEEGVLRMSEKSGGVVTVEDHQVMGGLGGALAELFASRRPTPMEFIGLQDTFAESGSPKDIMEKYDMDVEAIKAAVKRVSKRK
jgi:transketolase